MSSRSAERAGEFAAKHGAIHLAIASIVAADLIIAYDPSLLRTAEELGFRTPSPA